jgi:hypothetical protein
MIRRWPYVLIALLTLAAGCATDRTRFPPCDGRLVPINASALITNTKTNPMGVSHE